MSMAGPSRLGLGTAQFGLDYGITNSAGRVNERTVSAILESAVASGIDTVDTAHHYGNCEEILGRTLPAEAQVRIVTKTPKFGIGLAAREASAKLRSAFDHSLRSLGRGAVYGLLLHDSGDLKGPAGRVLWREMEELKAEGKVEKIGISIYEGKEIDWALDQFDLGLVQIPFNPIDRRLVKGGQIGRLEQAGVEIHARSVFLQGLLLQSPQSIPVRFGPVRSAVAEMVPQFQRAGLSQLEGILALAFQRNEIARFVCGVTTVDELVAIVSASAKAERTKERISFTPAELDSRFLNPVHWPELQ